jgi:hypothetical protein
VEGTDKYCAFFAAKIQRNGTCAEIDERYNRPVLERLTKLWIIAKPNSYEKYSTPFTTKRISCAASSIILKMLRPLPQPQFHSRRIPC